MTAASADSISNLIKENFDTMSWAAVVLTLKIDFFYNTLIDKVLNNIKTTIF